MNAGGANLRSRMLQAVFQLLYTRLGFLHETAGRVAHGAAWDGRRRHVVPTERRGSLLDLGCGEGRLLRSLAASGCLDVGIEPSPTMARRARARGVTVVRAGAQALPFSEGAFSHVIATYPGPWVLDPATWDEIARVTTHGATIRILLGGDYSQGPGAPIRRPLHRLAYGRASSPERLPTLGNQSVAGTYAQFNDAWGTALLWVGERIG